MGLALSLEREEDGDATGINHLRFRQNGEAASQPGGKGARGSVGGEAASQLGE
jgi:hypothetical protein